MKKTPLLLLIMFMLGGCTSSTLSFSKIELVPNNIQNVIDSDDESEHTLQLINEGESISYLVLHANGEVATHLVEEGNTLKITLDETNPENDDVQQHVYKITKDRKHKKIEVYVNGQPTPFDNVTGI